MLRIYRPESPIQWGWVALKGPDASDFLHRLTTVHVKALKLGEGAPGFLLNPQGKMRAYFHLWMISREEFFFEIDSGSSGKWKKEFLTVLDQFQFGEKFTTDAGDSGAFACAWILSDSAFDKALGFGEALHLSTPATGA